MSRTAHGRGRQVFGATYCVRCEHSPSTYDVPHRFTLSAVGELPFGKGKRFGSSWNAFIDAILGGWQANGILTLASGQPLVFATASNNSYTFGGGQHPDVVGNPVLSSGKSIYQWFNTAAFAQPANFSSGNLSRTYTGVRADWTRNLDFSLFKNFQPDRAIHASIPRRVIQSHQYPRVLGSWNYHQRGQLRRDHRSVQYAAEYTACSEAVVLAAGAMMQAGFDD